MNYHALKMPAQVYGGQGAAAAVGEIAQGHKKAVLFTDRGISVNGLLQKPLEQLKRAGVEVALFDDLPTEPSVYQADEVIRRFRAERPDLIVAVGGGSVMDVAKLCSVLDTDEYTVFDLLESPGAARKTVPTVMLPTTAGTGSEATPNSIVLVPEKELKIGIVNPQMIADYVILDAELLSKLPPKVCAATGVDALAHAIECYTSNKATPFSDLYALGALKLIYENLENAYSQPENFAAKQNMLLAAFYGGVSIAAAGTTAVHALAYPLGGKYHIAHGVSNAMMLTSVMRFNKPYCTDRLAKVCDALVPQPGLNENAKADWVLDWLDRIVQQVHIPTDLKEFGVRPEDLETLVTLGMDCKRLLNNNCRVVTEADARKLYADLLLN